MQLLRVIKSNIGNILFVLFAGIMFFSADARTLLIKGLMSTGLYNASAPSKVLTSSKSIPSDLTFRSEDGEILKPGENKGEVYFINFGQPGVHHAVLKCLL